MRFSVLSHSKLDEEFSPLCPHYTRTKFTRQSNAEIALYCVTFMTTLIRWQLITSHGSTVTSWASCGGRNILYSSMADPFQCPEWTCRFPFFLAEFLAQDGEQNSFVEGHAPPQSREFSLKPALKHNFVKSALGITCNLNNSSCQAD